MTVAADNQILDYDSIFFQGVVESRNDPLKLGRVKVRILGLHTDNFDLLKLDELPWAAILIPASDSAPGGQGISASGIPPGTHVFGMFLDGVNRQMPLVLGSIKGFPRKPEESLDRAGGEGDKKESDDAENIYPLAKEETELGVDFRKGFFDPQEEKLTGYPRPHRMKQAETHPFLRFAGSGGSQEKNIESERPKDALQNFRTGRDRFSEGDTIWKEPDSEKQTEYPYNRVYESESGIGSEIDDTPYRERNQQFFLPSTNYVEWATRNGVEMKRVWGASYDVRHSSAKKSYTWGERVNTIMGNVMEVAGKTKTTEIYDTETKIVYDSAKLRFFGQHNEWVGDNFTLMVNNDITITANNKMTLDVGSRYKESFHDTHHSVYWMRQYIWNEGQLHHIRKRDYFEKTNENHFTITWFDKRDVTIVGNKHWSVAGSYFIRTGICSGDFHHIIENGNHYLTVNGENHQSIKEDHFLTSKDANLKHDNEIKQTISFNHKTGDINEKVEQTRAISVGGMNKTRSADDFILVQNNKNTIVGSTTKHQTGSNSEEKVGGNKVLQIASDKLQQFKNGVTKATQWILGSSKIRIVSEMYDRISSASRHLMQSGALHSQNDFSGRVERNASFLINGDLGIQIDGVLRIKAKKGIYISCDEGPLVMASKGEMTIGSKTKYTSKAPADKLLHVEGDIELPKITVSTENLSGMDKSIPTIPSVSVTPEQFETPPSPKPPEKAKIAQLPPLPQIGEFTNARPKWASADSLSKDNDTSSDA